jgi:hypothetical protein
MARKTVDVEVDPPGHFDLVRVPSYN